MEVAWIVFWYLTMVLTMILAGFLVMSFSLYLSVKNDIENKKINLQIRHYDDEITDRAKFSNIKISPLKDNN